MAMLAWIAQVPGLLLAPTGIQKLAGCRSIDGGGVGVVGADG